MYYDQDKSFGEIAACIPSPRVEGGINVDTVRRVIHFFEVEGHVERPVRLKSPLMCDDHAHCLIAIITENPWLYLDEVSAALSHRCGQTYTTQRIHKELVARGFSLKVMQQAAQQRDERKREIYWFTLFDLGVRPEHLVFCDEASKKDSDLRRKRGWGGRGVRVTRKSFKHNEKNLSILALYGISGFIDFDCVDGGYTSASFIVAFEFMILPYLRPFPEPGNTSPKHRRCLLC